MSPRFWMMPALLLPVTQTPVFAKVEPNTTDIIITARHRSESIERVPIAISVITRDQIDKSYTVNTQQLTLLVPALNYSSANPRNTAITIRG